MNEPVKTLVFVVIAAVVLLSAILLRPTPFEQPSQRAGEKLFSDIEDAAVADALEIVRYDREQSKSKELTILRDRDEWVIASHNNYPADGDGAKERIEDVAVKLMNLEIVDVASELTDDHALFGVVEPPQGDDVLEADDEDVGLLVGLKDESGNTLARLIIGKEVRDEQSTDVKRFVRKAGEPTIYTAKIDVDDFKSEFSEWIESDLLQISGSDIRRVIVKDYNARLRQVLPGQYRIERFPRIELAADWNDTDSKWKLAELLENRRERMVPSELTENEELNTEKLNELKQAAGALEIVDVERIPKELLNGVKTEKDLVNDDRLRSMLAEKGFLPYRNELVGSEGEIRIQTSDAIEYILRFGNAAGLVTDDDNESKLTRYMLVSAAVAEAQLVAKPAPNSDSGPSINPPFTPPLGAGGQTGEDGDAGDEADVNTADETNTDNSNTEAGTDAEPTESDSSEPETTDDPAPEDSTADESAPTAGGEDDASPMPPDTIPPISEPDTSEQDDQIEAKRKEAEKKVADLNERFVNWYYVISEDEYKKLRLGRFDLIKEKEESSFGLDELRNLDDLPPQP